MKKQTIEPQPDPQVQKKQTIFGKAFGDKSFVKLLFKLFVPAVLQALISIVVLYVDNFSLAIILNGDNGTEGEMAKTALGLTTPVVNFVVYIMISWIGGTGIMMAQYYGNDEHIMTAKITSFRIWTLIAMVTPFVILMMTIPGKLITLTTGSQKIAANPEETAILEYEWELARRYLFWTGITYFPYVIAEALSRGLQETKRPIIALIAASVGMATNIVLDPICIIYADSTETAMMLVALSTGIARIVQTTFIIIYLIVKKDRYLWFFNKWTMTWDETKTVVKNGMAVFTNESIYSLINLILVVCLLSYNPLYHNQITNVVLLIEITMVVWPGFSAATAILIGSELGKGDIPQAKKNANHLMYWGAMFSFVMCLLILCASFFINQILSPTLKDYPDQLRIAQELDWMLIPIAGSQGLFSIAYYSIKSGGSKMILLIDCGVMMIWAIAMPIITFTGVAKNWRPMWFLLLSESNQIVKMILAMFMYKYYDWAKVLTKKI